MYRKEVHFENQLNNPEAQAWEEETQKVMTGLDSE